MIRYRPRPTTDKLVLHCSHTPPSKPALAEYLEANGRVLGLLEIGYHFVILRDGKLIETRPHTQQGSHLHGGNWSSIGVCLAGGLSELPSECFACGLDCGSCPPPEATPQDNFTPEQKATLKALVFEMRLIYGPQLQLLGHTEIGRHKHRAKRCPPCDMDALRKELDA